MEFIHFDWNSLFVCHMHAARKIHCMTWSCDPRWFLKKIIFCSIATIHERLNFHISVNGMRAIVFHVWFEYCRLRISTCMNEIRRMKIQFLVHYALWRPLNNFAMNCCSKNRKFMHLEINRHFRKLSNGCWKCI